MGKPKTDIKKSKGGIYESFKQKELSNFEYLKKVTTY